MVPGYRILGRDATPGTTPRDSEAQRHQSGNPIFVKLASEEDRVDFLDGNGVIVPGISAQLVGGHCPGQQIVVIDGQAPIVLASDALHFYEEMQRDMPFEVFTDLPRMYETYDLLRGLQDEQNAVIVAGHDPRVMEMFPAVPGHEGLAVRVSEGKGL